MDLNTLEIAQKIAPPSWMESKQTQQLMQVIGGGERRSAFVGGCVRNTLMGVAVHDIDIATQFTPDEIIEKLKVAQIKAIPTGLKHGTVTAVINGQAFEITTLRHDLVTDGRHAQIGFTQSWIEDAKRRDFTMNALLADMEGNIYDPTGQGVADLTARRVVFIGHPADRIAEDYLRILRFFRFHAFYGSGDMDAQALQECQAASEHIKTLSRERITSEFLKILSVDQCADVLEIMFKNNILNDLPDVNYSREALQKLCDLQTSLSCFGLTEGSQNTLPDASVKPKHDRGRRGETEALMARLFILSGNQPKYHGDMLRLTYAQKNSLVKLIMATNPHFYNDERALKKAIFYQGNDLLSQGYLILIANNKAEYDENLWNILQHWQAPKCPITGKTLITEGYQTGPDLGQELARRQEEWLEGVV